MTRPTIDLTGAPLSVSWLNFALPCFSGDGAGQLEALDESRPSPFQLNALYPRFALLRWGRRFRSMGAQSDCSAQVPTGLLQHHGEFARLDPSYAQPAESHHSLQLAIGRLNPRSPMIGVAEFVRLSRAATPRCVWSVHAELNAIVRTHRVLIALNLAVLQQELRPSDGLR